jgi:thiamine-phosphate pyrophosphorylase
LEAGSFLVATWLVSVQHAIWNMKPLQDCQLYTFIDTAYLHDRRPDDLARQLCDGGSDLIQLRAKTFGADQILRLAEMILPITDTAGVGLVINDHPQIALKAGAMACHLGQEDFFDSGYLRATQVTGCPPQIKLGLSTHEPEQAKRAIQAGPDYVAIGPVYATPTKPTARPVSLDYVRWAAVTLELPWFAIGGINQQNLTEVLEAGAVRICVVSAILNAPDATRACQHFKQHLGCASLKTSK